MVFRSPLLWATAGVSLATVPNNARPDTIPEKIAPGAKPTEPTENLSRELNQSNGVIHPKEVDPAMNKAAPDTQDENVIRPPGTRGGSPAPQPK